ncbi:cGMP-dependent 3',5'-cyclic phosphodiesterase [Encephalitozoon hellem]|uniref:cGMP-dependent 3',5'-cyclic phosphodiesterase n=1 Tax=Encephalitozoon hellem TaxID=27973 RepID=A0ABY8CKN1_ENCHE|nr:cGMP-dependent 3',5'-cyclic phosphodiesterase [Encephalitozoon hellem]
MDQSEEISKYICDTVVRVAEGKKSFYSRPMEDFQLDLSSYKFFHLEGISLADAISAAVQTLVKDSRFSLLEVNLEALKSFFSFSFLHVLPHRYHNLDHLINTLCFGDFILRRLERICCLSMLDKMCLVIALSLHDVGHPGEKSRERIGRLYEIYGSPNAMSFEVIHAAICRKGIVRYRRKLFGSMDNVEFEKRLDFIKKMIFATDLQLNKEIIDAFEEKYFEKEKPGRAAKSNAKREVSEIELKMIVKIADLSSCYKDYKIFNKNSIAFWSEMYDDDSYNRTLKDICEDIKLLENVSIPLADSFSLVFEDFRFLYNQALVNLEEHKKYYKELEKEHGLGHSLAGEENGPEACAH